MSAESIAPQAVQRLRFETVSPSRGQNPQPSVPPFSLPGVGSQIIENDPAYDHQAEIPAISYLSESSLYGLRTWAKGQITHVVPGSCFHSRDFISFIGYPKVFECSRWLIQL